MRLHHGNSKGYWYQYNHGNLIEHGKGCRPRVNILRAKREPSVNHGAVNCNDETKCFYCKANHADDKICPELLRQQRVKEPMSLHNLSIYEADKTTKPRSGALPSEFPSFYNNNSFTYNHSRNHSYAEVIKSPASLPKIVPNSQKRKAPNSPSFDNTAHSKCLMSSKFIYHRGRQLPQVPMNFNQEKTTTTAIAHNEYLSEMNTDF
ncbi:hypothetical protein HHI36_005362 [Cryptolaemus montrouzieri]|uniref:Uncharacterized protein n=1 Tax=Cryptolaemus montrouzieri TaxID=559131 RepID=A0ABD2NUE5_9CUCU